MHLRALVPLNVINLASLFQKLLFLIVLDNHLLADVHENCRMLHTVDIGTVEIEMQTSCLSQFFVNGDNWGAQNICNSQLISHFLNFYWTL